MLKLILSFTIATHYCIAETEISNRTIPDDINDIQTQNVFLGNTVVLHCRSNDMDHNFMFWQLPQNEGVVGPGNKFDDLKYNYEVLSGKLFIKRVSTAEEGTYHCVSEGVKNSNIKIRSVRMVVNQEDNSSINYFKGVMVITSLVIVGGLCYLIQRIRKRRRFQSLLELPLDEEESGEVFFTAPEPSGSSGNIVRNKSEEQETLVEINIPHISIDLDDDLVDAQEK